MSAAPASSCLPLPDSLRCSSKDRQLISIALAALFVLAAGQTCLATAQMIQPTPPEPQQSRILHFPEDRSVGQLFVQDAGRVRQIADFFHWGDPTEWEDLREARGDVPVPSGKRLSLTVNQTAWQDLSWLSRLGPDDLYKLGFAFYSGSSDNAIRLSGQNLEHLARLTGLKSLTLTWTVISDKDMEYLRRFTSLEYLEIPRGLTDAGVAIIGELPLLKGLYLFGHPTNRFTNAGLRHLSKLNSLEELYIGGDYIGDAGLAHLRGLPRLQYLLLCGSKFTDAGLVHLKDMPSLRILSLMEGLCQVTDAGLISISSMPKLENLYLDVKGPISDDGLAHLSKMRSLKKLHFGRAQITDKGLKYLGQIRTLERLDLPQEQKGITDIGITYLGELTNLRDLSISRIHFVDPKMNKDYYTDKGLAALVNCRDIENLSIGSIGITDLGMAHIAKLTNLKRLHLFGCDNVTDAGLAKLTALKSLKYLDIFHADITIAGINNLKPMPNLTKLDVTRLNRGGTVLDISGLIALEELSLSFRPPSTDTFTDADLMCLRGLKHLRWLQIGPRSFSDTGLSYLAGLSNMERLGIGGPGITDEGFKHLVNMKKLNHLNIAGVVGGSGGNITDKGLQYLEEIKLLGFLLINSDNTFSPGALQHLRQGLPDLSFLTVNGTSVLPTPAPQNPPAPAQPTRPAPARQATPKPSRRR